MQCFVRHRKLWLKYEERANVAEMEAEKQKARAEAAEVDADRWKNRADEAEHAYDNAAAEIGRLLAVVDTAREYANELREFSYAASRELHQILDAAGAPDRDEITQRFEAAADRIVESFRGQLETEVAVPRETLKYLMYATEDRDGYESMATRKARRILEGRG